jgi:hypothetical protein
MKERPILFSTEMVKAILEGRKTQTRRPIKLRDFRPCDNVPGSDWYFRANMGIWSDVSNKKLLEKYCLFGKTGDHLWEKLGIKQRIAISSQIRLFIKQMTGNSLSRDIQDGDHPSICRAGLPGLIWKFWTFAFSDCLKSQMKIL